MSAASQISLTRETRDGGTVVFLAIDNDRRLNSMNSALMDEFVAAVDALAEDEDVRAVVLTGAGERAFIGGADIDEMAALDGPDAARAFITRVHLCCAALRDLPVPVIARIQGYTFGAGLEVAASCDLRIAAENAVFGMPEVRLGIPSVVEAALLPTLAGWGRTREILLLGENFTAREAHDWKLVEKVVPAAELDAGVEAWLGALLKCTPRAVRLQKRLIRQWEQLPLGEAISAGIDAFAAAFETDEPIDAMAAFRAGRRKAKGGAGD